MMTPRLWLANAAIMSRLADQVSGTELEFSAPLAIRLRDAERLMREYADQLGRRDQSPTLSAS